MRAEQGRGSTLIFCQSIRALDALQSEFDDRRIPAASVTGKTRFQDRLAILKEFNEGSIKVLINCCALIEGVNLPRVRIIASLLQTSFRAYILDSC